MTKKLYEKFEVSQITEELFFQELEKFNEEITKLEIEKQALKKEPGSEKRLKAISRELADLNEKSKIIAKKGFYDGWPDRYLELLFKYRKDPRSV